MGRAPSPPQAMAEVDLFAGLTKKQLARLLAAAKELSHPEGTEMVTAIGDKLLVEMCRRWREKDSSPTS